jgi:hypothetical protein
MCRAALPIANMQHKIATLCPMIDVSNCHTHFALSENQGSSSYHYASGASGRTTFPDCQTVLRRTLFLSGLEGSSGIFGPRGHNYPPPTLGYGKNLPPQTQLTLSQLESNIRKKLSPAEADNIVLDASLKNG